MLAAVVISNVPEGLSSAAGMKHAGRSAGYVFGVWGGIAAVSGVAALLGYLLLQSASASTVAVITAVAAGAILAMLATGQDALRSTAWLVDPRISPASRPRP